MVSIVDLAKMVSKNIKHIPNPRKENETFKMKFENKEFLKVLGKEPTTIKKGILNMLGFLNQEDTLFYNKKDNWDYIHGSSD